MDFNNKVFMDKFINKIFQGDCLEIMRQMPDKSFDLVLTDPPYGIDFQSAWRTDKSKWKPKIANDKAPFIWFLREVARLMKDDSAILKDLITATVAEGGVVFDPFAGSCATLLAAKELHRSYVGIELSADYVRICNERLLEPAPPVNLSFENANS